MNNANKEVLLYMNYKIRFIEDRFVFETDGGLAHVIKKKDGKYERVTLLIKWSSHKPTKTFDTFEEAIVDIGLSPVDIVAFKSGELFDQLQKFKAL